MEIRTQPVADTTTTIRADDRTDRRRWRCPNNHREWEPTAGGAGIYCVTCARAVGVDPEYDAILDTRHDERVAWGEVSLVWESADGSMLFRGQVYADGAELAVEIPPAMLDAVGLETGAQAHLERDRGGDPETVLKIEQQ